jgi:hypothetical protein
LQIGQSLSAEHGDSTTALLRSNARRAPAPHTRLKRWGPSHVVRRFIPRLPSATKTTSLATAQTKSQTIGRTGRAYGDLWYLWMGELLLLDSCILVYLSMTQCCALFPYGGMHDGKVGDSDGFLVFCELTILSCRLDYMASSCSTVFRSVYSAHLLFFWPFSVLEIAFRWVKSRELSNNMMDANRWMSATVGSVPQTYEPISEVGQTKLNPKMVDRTSTNSHHTRSRSMLINFALAQDGGRLQPAEGVYPGANISGSSSDLDFDLHAQLEQLGLLMAAITNDVISPETVPLNTVRVYSDRLKAWHANLPSSLTLSTAIRESYESPRKNSTLLIHCAYLGSITQLTRRVLVERVATQLTGSLTFPRGENMGGGGALTEANTTHGEEFSKICISAARQLATVCTHLIGSVCPKQKKKKKKKVA